MDKASVCAVYNLEVETGLRETGRSARRCKFERLFAALDPSAQPRSAQVTCTFALSS